MKHNAYHQLMDRYLDGDMTFAERASFELGAAGDPALDQMLKAEMLIRGALSNDRAAIRSEHAALRAHLASMLGTIPANTALQVANAGAGGLATGVFKTIMPVLGSLGLIVATLFVVLPVDPANRMATDTPAASDPALRETPVQLQDGTYESDASSDAAIRTAPAPATDAKPVPAGSFAEPERDVSSDADAHPAASTPGASILSSDTVRMRLSIDLNKLKDREAR